MSFALSVLALFLFSACKENHRDYRGDVSIYESFMVAQSDTIVRELFETNCGDLNRHFLISDTASFHQVNCLLLDTLRSSFSIHFQNLPADVHYTYAEVPEHIVTRVDQALVHGVDTLKLSCWFFNSVDWNNESFDSSSTTPVALELWYKNERVYTLHQYGF